MGHAVVDLLADGIGGEHQFDQPRQDIELVGVLGVDILHRAKI